MSTKLATRPIRLRAEHLPADEAFLIRLFAEARAHIFGTMPLPPEQKRMLIENQFHTQRFSYQNQFTDPAPKFRIIELDGIAAGRFYTHETPADIRIIDIALMPEQRGRGVGETLLKKTISRAQKRGKTVSLSVEAQNPALRLYERLGFERTTFSDPYWQMVRMPASAR